MGDAVSSVSGVVSSPVGVAGWRGRAASFPFKSKKKAATPKARSTSESRARLSLVLLGYFLGIVVVIKLAPFVFSFPSAIRLDASLRWFDLATDALLFVPLGFLFPLARRGEDLSTFRVLFCGAAVGSAIEV